MSTTTPVSLRARKTPAPSQPKFTAAESVFLAAAVDDGLRIQACFRPEPLLARTGRGFMESTGVSEIAAAKQNRRASRK